MKSALLLLNLQIDFFMGGMMETSESDTILSDVIKKCDNYDVIVATQQWHPATHCSFAANHLWRKPEQTINFQGRQQKLYPMHCVQDSFGAELHPKIAIFKLNYTLKLGASENEDHFSAFFDTNEGSTGLLEILMDNKIDTLHIMGIESENLLNNTVLDAQRLGFKTTF